MSSDERKDRYVQFPLCLLMETYRNNYDGFGQIIRFGIVNYAKSFKYDISEVGRQLMYCYYRDQSIIPNQLLKTLQDYIDSDELSIDEDYCGFVAGSFGSFDPLAVSVELLSLFESDIEFKDKAILLYQIRQSVSEENLNIDIGNIDNLIEYYNRGLIIKKSFESKFGPDVMPSIKPSLLIQFRDSCEDLDTFRAFIGIKSLIGRNTFATANKPVILSRMIGCKSKAAFEHYQTDKHLLPTVEKYSKKYQMDKLLLNLAQSKFIMFLSKAKVSVLYLSQYMEPEELVTIIKQTKERQDLKNRIRGATASL